MAEKKVTTRAKKTAEAVKEKTAETKAKKTAAPRTASKPKEAVKAAAPKLEIYVQSPLGGNITPEEIAAKLPEGVEAVFVRVDQNKLWWVKGEETGSVDIW